MERAAWVALSAVSGMGPARFRQVLEAFGSALEALEAGPDEVRERAGIPESVIEQWGEAAGQIEVVQEGLASLDEQGVRALIWDDEDYPARLLATSSPPPVLWWTGDAALNPPARAAAVVGSREVSEGGCEAARAAGAALAGAGIVVVSGLAAGIDGAAHEGALEAGGPTVGVCGCGLSTALVGGRGGLAAQVAEGGGLCSELSPTAPMLTQTLFARDRIIAGLACAVIVVEARAEGGAVHTANCALKEGRPVLAIEWPAGHPAGGNRQLLAEGARALQPGEDIVAAFESAAEG